MYQTIVKKNKQIAKASFLYLLYINDYIKGTVKLNFRLFFQDGKCFPVSRNCVPVSWKISPFFENQITYLGNWETFLGNCETFLRNQETFSGQQDIFLVHRVTHWTSNTFYHKAFKKYWETGLHFRKLGHNFGKLTVIHFHFSGNRGNFGKSGYTFGRSVVTLFLISGHFWVNNSHSANNMAILTILKRNTKTSFHCPFGAP